MATTEVLVDSNVVLDVVTRDAVWLDWSLGQLKAAALQSTLIVNGIVFAEVSSRYTRLEEVR